MESQPQNPEFRNNLENFHPCTWLTIVLYEGCVSNSGGNPKTFHLKCRDFTMH